MHQDIRFCNSKDNIRLAYAITGNGPPLVKAANWLSHIEHEWDSPVWRHWYRTLARKFTLIRYDQRGCGLSDRSVHPITFDTWLEDLETVVAATGLNKFTLLGISQGGAVAAAYAAVHPDRVSRLILYGSYLRGRLHRNLTPRQTEETELFLNLIRMGWESESPAFRQVFTTLFQPDASSEQIRSLNQIHKASCSTETALQIVNCFDRIDCQRTAGNISIPTLIFHAREDARVPFEEGCKTASLIPNSRFISLNSKNHILLENEPAWKTFITELLNFTKMDRDGVKTAFTVLTSREQEVVELIAQGLSNDQIAQKLFISPKTVRNHITHIFGKLSIQNRAQVIVTAREAGFGHGTSV